MRARPITRLWLLVLPLVSCQALPNLLSGNLSAPDDLPVLQVRRVLSGQTLEVVGAADRVPRRLRLLGIDAPDLQQAPWGDRARQALEALTLGQTVRADIRRRDRFGRDWSYVWLEGQLINERMVATGWALTASELSDPEYARALQHAQERARLLTLGIWNPTAPLRQPPQNFRAQRRNFPDNKGN